MLLYAHDMLFKGDTEAQRAHDCCIHGKIIFKIGEKMLSNNDEWCLSAWLIDFYIPSLKTIL